ncbi:DNA-directed RNA polymerase II subunit RPB1-like protein [Trema orientale]|uniref:DNA-directed RNA polymerase II subunit RPB1-like protein n=1 Tax=Trema orientale TaxID=63057 RepID=A0A2P5FY96_TREOI|nr:DNA-directed RNA polymerase II subunit RPB1-like protein [Trema orientale]
MMTRLAILLIFLIICHEVMNIEARHLKPCKKGHSRHGHHEKSATTLVYAANGRSNLPQQQEQTSKDVIDDFRPTSPGHSPGVGHSINN